jgi:8-oxo-dGTP pyrophosphatase MutT (NUDIX family)
MKILSKVGVFVVRRCAGPGAELLLFSLAGDLYAPLQIPGGGIASREEPYAAALRELAAKAGIEFLPLIRPLGVFETRPAALPNTLSRRYCYLFDGAGLPDRWTHEAAGMAGEECEDSAREQNKDRPKLRVAYRWHGIDSDFRLRGDLNYFLNAEAIPELFEAELQ